MSKRRQMATKSGRSQESNNYSLQPFVYIHVLDQNTNVTRVEFGPQTFFCQDHERVVFGPERMIVVPPRHYIRIKNPVLFSDAGEPVVDRHGQIELRHGEEEIRVAQDPFPLFPGEVRVHDIKPLRLIPKDTALHVRALQNFEEKGAGSDDDAKASMTRVAGDEWLVEGPTLYVPHPNVDVIGEFRATVIKENQALRLTAKQDTVDRQGEKRVAGEEWLVRTVGTYLPGVFEKVVSVVAAQLLTDVTAIHVRALESFTDQFGNPRKTGEEWLVTNEVTATYIPSVHEAIIRTLQITTLTNLQYCVILDPYDPVTHQNQLGTKKLVKGEASFFLQPGERLEAGVQDVFILNEDEGLILSATEKFVDMIPDEKGETQEVPRGPGDRWMIRGPMEYVPPVQASVVRKNRAIPLHKNEGVYVRDIKSGHVRAVIGHTYLLNEHEELWQKKLSDQVERLLSAPSEFGRIPEEEMKEIRRQRGARDKTRVVTYRVPHNSCVQIYDFRQKTARVVFGAALVMLGPDEEFTPLILSGGVPKKVGQIQTLHLMLGPDFCTDMIAVETSDHAKLNLVLSYNWRFEVPEEAKKDQEFAQRLFSVGDFIGDACTKVASRVRGAVAGVAFDDFHKNSARMIRASVFGIEQGKVRETFQFRYNNFMITGVDIKSIEPDNRRTRDLLQQSVQLAISITTQSQQAVAQQEADRRDQVARGKLQRQKINDDAEAEAMRKDLTELQAESRAVQTTGQARAEAQSRAAASRIEGESQVEQARLRAEARKVQMDSDMKLTALQRKAELDYLKRKQTLEAAHTATLAEIESEKFQNMMAAIGNETIRSIATAGPQLTRSMVAGLGIRNVLITDSEAPINLFQSTGGGRTRFPLAAITGADRDDYKD